jgi:hypothetical protein
MSDTLRRQVVYHSGFSLTRIMVHAACLLRGPGKAAFFFAGIRRELSLLHHVKGAFIAAMFTTVLTLSAGWRYFLAAYLSRYLRAGGDCGRSVFPEL